MLISISVIITASIIDSSIVKFSVFMGNLSSTSDIIVFSVMVAIFVVGQYIILLFIRKKFVLNKVPEVNTIYMIVSIIQYFLISVFVIIILQMIFTSYYSLFLLNLLMWTSYG